MTYQYIIYQSVNNKDMFAFLGEHIFYYQTDTLIKDSLQITSNIYLLNDNNIKQNLPTNLEFIGLRDSLATLSQADFYLLSRASQIHYWYQTHQFCSRCGTKTVFDMYKQTGELASECPSCHYHQYPRVQPCTITAITRVKNGKTQILLAHHQRAKTTKMYSLIAGFVEVGETLEQCVMREVAEEVGLTVNNIRYVASQPWAFATNLMTGFVADYVHGEICIDSNELIDAQFFDLDDLPKIPDKGTIAYDLITFVKDQANKKAN